MLLAYFCKQKCCQELSKIAKSGHTARDLNGAMNLIWVRDLYEVVDLNGARDLNGFGDLNVVVEPCLVL